MNRISVIGAGIMGNGIAQVIATAGISVSLYDNNQLSLSKAFTTIEKNIDQMINQSILDENEKISIMERIDGTIELEKCLRDTDMVIEVVPENLELKQNIYKEIEAIVSDNVIIASNTSAIPLSELTEQAKIPSRFIITHFLNPATIVPLVEIITQDDTDKQVLTETMGMIKKINKVPVHLKKEIPGAVVNRLQAAFLRESFHLVEEGVVTLQDIDDIVKEGIGFRWGFIGPMEMVDLGGLDTWGQILDHLSPELNRSTKRSYIVDKLVNEGSLGIKTGKGIYEYQKGDVDRAISKRDHDFIELLKLKQ